MLNRISAENEIRRREIETQKELIRRQLDSCKNDDEKARLMK